MFEWQVGNTTRFIKFNTVTDVEYKEDCSTFDVYCGQTIVSVPNELREQFKAKYEEWKKQMKNYKVGDTIYVKGKIVEIDHDDTDLPYCVNVGPISGIWPDRSDIVDELPAAEPVKPVLPKAVADELESAKENCNNFYGFLRDCNSETHPEANQFVFYSCGSSDSRIKILSDAWYNGYTIEKPKLYNLVLGKDSHGDTNAFVKAGDSSISYLMIDPFIDCEDDLQSDSDYQFTQEEIDKYNKNFWIKNIDLNDYKVEVEE